MPSSNLASTCSLIPVCPQSASRFAPTGHALRNMERVAAAVSLAEPVLLVGETGTGKTTLVQQIAKQVGKDGGGAGLGTDRVAEWLAVGGHWTVCQASHAPAAALQATSVCMLVEMRTLPHCWYGPSTRRWAPSWWCST